MKIMRTEEYTIRHSFSLYEAGVQEAKKLLIDGRISTTAQY